VATAATASLELQQSQADTEVLTDRLTTINDQIRRMEQADDLDATSDTTSLYKEAGDISEMMRRKLHHHQQSLTALIINLTSTPAPPTPTARGVAGASPREAFLAPPRSTGAEADEPPSGGDQFNHPSALQAARIKL
jgi:hypothetical protein